MMGCGRILSRDCVPAVRIALTPSYSRQGSQCEPDQVRLHSDRNMSNVHCDHNSRDEIHPQVENTSSPCSLLLIKLFQVEL